MGSRPRHPPSDLGNFTIKNRLCAPIWYPIVKNRLQCIQNRELRIVTGCHKMASWQHLHNEAKLLSVVEHCRMLSAQYLAMALQRIHPSFEAISRQAGPRDKKATVKSALHNDVSPHLVDGAIPPGELGIIRNRIHTSSIANSEALNSPNPLIGISPPPVDPSEASLPRPVRSTLSTNCVHLNDVHHTAFI